MINLRKALHPYLKNLYDRVYFQQAPDTAQLPYIVYDITSILDDGEGTQIVTLEIDGWDNAKDTTALENMMETINQINKTVITTDDLSVVFYLEGKYGFIEDDTKYNRRRYSYTGYLYERS